MNNKRKHNKIWMEQGKIEEKVASSWNEYTVKKKGKVEKKLPIEWWIYWIIEAKE